MPKLTLRRALAASALCLAVGLCVAGRFELAAADTAASGGASLEAIETMLTTLKLKPQKTESRFDFKFASKNKDGDEWELAMSVVLSNDAKTIWLTAWLDELPQNAADVPRSALLRLLADNDRMGNGQFFGYVAGNRKFVLQRVIKNENLTSTSLKADLLELGRTVMNTHPHWSVAQWKDLGNNAPATESSSEPAGKGTESAAKTGTTSKK